MEGGRRSFWRSRGAKATLALAGLATVLAAPLAVQSRQPASAITIAGARSITDRVEVTFANAPAARTTDIHLLAYNDFHGNLEAGSLNIYGQFAGGAAYLAKAIKDRQAQFPKHITVMAGDNIGASPLANGLFFEEPATVVSNLMFTDFASVGNHEFDKGSAELLRIQQGGCKPVDGCTAKPYAKPYGKKTNVFPGADFNYLSTNVIVDSTGKTLFPAYGVKQVVDRGVGINIGFIGEVLEATPTIVTPTGVAGLTFQDEADAANKAVKQLKRKGVKTIVLLIHQGGFQSSGAALNGCAGNLAGSDIAEIAARLDPAIKVIVSAHTHAEYRCTITIGGVTRLITSASSFGRVFSDITLTVDRKTGELVQAEAENVVVGNALNAPAPPGQPAVTRIPDPSREDPAVAAVVNQYVTAVAPLANQVIGSITDNLSRTANALGESALGDVIADAQLAATTPANLGGSQVAFMNPGGIRGDFTFSQNSGGEQAGQVTYGEAFTVQPFGNTVVVKTMTGAQIRALLEQQFAGCRGQITTRILQISNGFSYQQNPAAATCEGRIGTITLNGAPVGDATSYRVTMNSFLAAGGDGFTVFNQGTNPLGGEVDLDALVAYFDDNSPVAPGPQNRITPIPAP